MRVIHSAVAITIILLCSLASAQEREIPEQSMDAAQGMADVVNEKMGSAQSLQKNAITPLSSDTKMTTFDGNTSFDAQLLCSGATTFADLMTVPLSNGNIQIQTIRQDTDLDGTIDSYQNPGWEATAICANGYMYCTDVNEPGSCQSYQWVANNQNYLVGIKQTPMNDLGGCYCINNACGNNLVMNNLDTVLGDLASGMAAALASAHHFFTLTNINIDGTFAEMQGSDGASCNPSSAESMLGTEDVGSLVGADYVNNPSRLSDDGFSAKEDHPLYQDLERSAEDHGFEDRSCEVRRIVEEDKVTGPDIVSFDAGSGGLYELDNDTMRIILGKVGNNYWSGNCSYFTLQSSFFVRRPDRIKKATLLQAQFDDWMQVHILQDGEFTHVWNGPGGAHGNWTSPTGPVPGACELATNWQMNNLNTDFTDAFTEEGQVTFRVRVEVSGEGEGYVLGDVELDTSCNVKPDQQVNSCTAYQSNDDCTLVEEEVDGVKTFSNGHSTGLFPTPSEVGPFCGEPVRRDWMVKKRTYRCESDYEYDFSEGFKRVEYVKESSTKEHWSDRSVGYDDNEASYGSGDFSYFSGLGAQECSQTCKTRKERPMNDMTLDGTTGSKQENPVTYDFFYHQCTGADYQTCPSGEGEEVIKDCQCINEFTEATSIMQALRLAGQDMICTNGEPAFPDEGR